MKIIHLLTICTAMLFSITSNYGQEMNLSNKGLGITVGYNYGYFKDLNYSPLNYQQKGLSIAFDYTFPNRRNGDLLNIHLDFSPNTIETATAEYFTADFYNGSIQFDYLKKLNTSNAKLSTYLGGQFNTDNTFVFWENTNSFTYNFAHSLSVKGQVGWQLGNGNIIQSSLAIPIVNWSVRPPYNGFNKTTEANEERYLRLLTEEGKLTTMNKYFAIDWDIQYRIVTKGRWDLALQYGVQYQHYNDVHSLTRLQNQFAVTGILKF